MKKMKNALIALIFALTLLLAAQAAYSKSDNETLASEFLEEVAGVEMSAYTVISFDASRARMPSSEHYETCINIVLGDSNCEFEALITYVDGRFWSYRLDMLQGELANETSTDGCLARASRAVTEYQARFNASYCNGFAQMIPTSLQAQEFTAEKDSIILNINCRNDTAKSAESVYLSWSEKISGRFITPTRSVTMSVSKTGILTRLLDNMAVYQIASESVSLAEQEATALASQHVEAYANRNGQKVKAMNTTLDFASDITSSRGDRFLLYPRWTILATFDKANTENVFGYAVMIWADTGAIYHEGPQGSYAAAEGNDFSYLAWPLGTAVFVIAVLSSTVACLQVRNRTRVGKNK